MANCLCDLRNSGNKHQITNVALEWAHKQFVTRVHTIILFFIRHNDSINGDKTTIFLYRPRVSLAWFTFCWWRHNRLLMMSQWPDNSNYDAITWMVISNSLDIDFIHGDIHDRSCKKPQIAKFMQPTWGPPGAHLGPVGPRWASRGPHEAWIQGHVVLFIADIVSMPLGILPHIW